MGRLQQVKFLVPMDGVEPLSNSVELCAYAVGESFSRGICLSREEIGQMAALAGDMNPLHHDDALARRSRFGTVIASGGHVAAMMMGALAQFLTERGAGIGLEVGFVLRKAVPAESRLSVRWTIREVRPKASLSGHLVVVEGELADDRGTIYVKSTATCAVSRESVI